MNEPLPDDPHAIDAQPGDPGAVGAQEVMGQDHDEPEERVYVSRSLLWLAVLLVVIAGLVLYFLFARGQPPLVG